PVVALADCSPVADPAPAPVPPRDLIGPPVVDPYSRDPLGDLLTVGPHVLDRRGTRVPRDSREALEARPPSGHRRGDHVIPGLTSGHLDYDVRLVILHHLDAPRTHQDHRAGEARVGDHHVATAAEQERRLTPRRRGSYTLYDFVLITGGDQLFGRPSDTQRGQVSKRRQTGRRGHGLPVGASVGHAPTLGWNPARA